MGRARLHGRNPDRACFARGPEGRRRAEPVPSPAWWRPNPLMESAGIACAGLAAGRFRPNAVQSALPDDGRFRQTPSRVLRRRSSTGGHRLGISHSPPTRRRSGTPPRDRRVPPPAPDGHLRVRLAGQQRIPGHAPLRVELARRRAPHRVALNNPPSGATARCATARRATARRGRHRPLRQQRATGRSRPHDQPPARAGSPGTGARSIPRTGRLSPAPTRGEGPPPTGAIP